LSEARTLATVAQLTCFDEVVDVRTPMEYAEDHVPGAANRPVLSNEERAQVGTLYKQVSPFTARRVGAALAARNIAHHIETAFADRPRSWRPLVYCWRGGKRSEALVHMLREVGWQAQRLEGGYKAYRRAVREELPQLARRLHMRVVCGLTGSGKSRLLETLERLGAQVLDLERLAAHRGSVLGNLPGAPQPSQKMFESRLWHRLRGLDPQRPVFVESESARIGTLHVPDELMARLWEGECVRVETRLAARLSLLKAEYAHFLADPASLGGQLDCLVALHGHAAIDRWKDMALRGDWDLLVGELLERHYDPAYRRSILGHYPGLAHAQAVYIESPEEESFLAAARLLIALPAAAPA